MVWKSELISCSSSKHAAACPDVDILRMPAASQNLGNTNVTLWSSCTTMPLHLAQAIKVKLLAYMEAMTFYICLEVFHGPSLGPPPG